MTIPTAAAKACTRCGKTKPLDEYSRSKPAPDGRHSVCLVCRREEHKGRYQRWTPEQREKHRARVLRSRYGLALDQLVAMYERQEGCCAICGTAGDRPATNEKRKTHVGVLCVDHDHDTNEVRGLLCTNCNVGLGKFGDDSATLVRAAAYLLNEGAN